MLRCLAGARHEPPSFRTERAGGVRVPRHLQKNAGRVPRSTLGTFEHKLSCPAAAVVDAGEHGAPEVAGSDMPAQSERHAVSTYLFDDVEMGLDRVGGRVECRVQLLSG